MNLLSRYLKFSSVRLDLDIASQKRLFEEASFTLQTAYGTPHDEVFAALSERAVPHGRLQGLEEPAIAFLRTKEPLRLPSPDGSGAQLFIVILVPWAHPERHLALLRETAALFSDDATREALLAAPSQTEFCEIVTAWSAPENLHAEEEPAAQED